MGIVCRDLIAVDKIGRQDRQIGAAGVAQQRKQDIAKPGRNDHVRKLHDEGIFLSTRAIWRQAQFHSCQAPSQMSGSNPCDRWATSASVIL